MEDSREAHRRFEACSHGDTGKPGRAFRRLPRARASSVHPLRRPTDRHAHPSTITPSFTCERTHTGVESNGPILPWGAYIQGLHNKAFSCQKNAPKMGEVRLFIFYTSQDARHPRAPRRRLYDYVHRQYDRLQHQGASRQGALRPHALGPYSRFPVLGIDMRPRSYLGSPFHHLLAHATMEA